MYKNQLGLDTFIETDDSLIMELNRSLLFQIVLIEIAMLSILWLTNDYIGSLVSLTLGLLLLSIWILSVLVEFIERSKVPKWYFRLILLSALTCLGVFILFTIIKGGQFDWMESII